MIISIIIVFSTLKYSRATIVPMCLRSVSITCSIAFSPAKQLSELAKHVCICLVYNIEVCAKIIIFIILVSF